MENRHQAEIKTVLQRQSQELHIEYEARVLAGIAFRLSQRQVMARVVEVSAAEISNITKQMEEKPPLEIREMIYALCWDDVSLTWAQDLLRFSQILDERPDFYSPYKPLDSLEVRQELPDTDFVQQGHLSGM